MIELGKIQTLHVMRQTEHGVYLNDLQDPSEKDVLLPSNQVSEDIEVDSAVEVFVYRDSEDRLIATIRKPKVTLGKVAKLKVVSISHIGAFVEWGLERDLFLPFKQQLGQIQKDESYVVGVYIDKSNRLCATMKIYDLLSCQSPYAVKDEVKGIIYNVKEAFGAFVAVEGKYHGLIPPKELYTQYKIGDEVEVRVKAIKSDGKLELSPRAPLYLQMEKDAQVIMEALEKNGGQLALHDKSTPEAIKEALMMSKASFKRAVGRLLKEGAISLVEGGIKRNW